MEFDINKIIINIPGNIAPNNRYICDQCVILFDNITNYMTIHTADSVVLFRFDQVDEIRAIFKDKNPHILIGKHGLTPGCSESEMRRLVDWLCNKRLSIREEKPRFF